jgi:hypothetical protein
MASSEILRHNLKIFGRPGSVPAIAGCGSLSSGILRHLCRLDRKFHFDHTGRVFNVFNSRKICLCNSEYRIPPLEQILPANHLYANEIWINASFFFTPMEDEIRRVYLFSRKYGEKHQFYNDTAHVSSSILPSTILIFALHFIHVRTLFKSTPACSISLQMGLATSANPLHPTQK